MKPACLYHAVGHDTILCFSARTGDDVLALRGPRDEVVTHEHHVARSGSASVGTTDSVSISVDDEVQHRGVVKKQDVVEGALQVSEYALRGHEMRLTGILHVEAH
jgi:hypothetical protein